MQHVGGAGDASRAGANAGLLTKLLLLSEGQMSDFKGAALMIDDLPPAKVLLGDKGYDAEWFRDALAKRGIKACISSKSNRKNSSRTTGPTIASATD